MGNAADADGNSVLPQLETPFYKFGFSGLKRVRRMYFTYDIRTAGASPYLQVSSVLSPESTSYVMNTPNLVTTTQQQRAAVDIRRKANGIGLKIAQAGLSADTRLSEIEFEGHTRQTVK